MCFNILDSNQDGEISDTDMFNIFEKSINNPLIESDYRTITKYWKDNSESNLLSPSVELFTTQPTYLSFLNKRNSVNK